MELTAIYKRVIGLDVHQAKISACAVAEQADGKVTVESREFGGFKRDRRALAEWARSFGPEVVVMESTGIYWKSPYAALQAVGIAAWVVNARRVLYRAGAQDRCGRCSVAGHLGACGLAARVIHPEGRHPIPAADRAPAPKARWNAGLGEEPLAQAAGRCGHPAQCGGQRHSWAGRARHGQGVD